MWYFIADSFLLGGWADTLPISAMDETRSAKQIAFMGMLRENGFVGRNIASSEADRKRKGQPAKWVIFCELDFVARERFIAHLRGETQDVIREEHGRGTTAIAVHGLEVKGKCRGRAPVLPKGTRETWQLTTTFLEGAI